MRRGADRGEEGHRFQLTQITNCTSYLGFVFGPDVTTHLGLAASPTGVQITSRSVSGSETAAIQPRCSEAPGYDRRR